MRGSLNTAIAAAESAGDANRDTLYAALAAAINTFKAELKPGTRAKTVTITGLPSTAKGARIQAGICAAKPVNGSKAQTYTVGEGLVENGRATLSLYLNEVMRNIF